MTKEQENEKLDACAHCGSLHIQEDDNGARFWIKCRHCGIETKTYPSKGPARAAWNRRVVKSEEQAQPEWIQTANVTETGDYVVFAPNAVPTQSRMLTVSVYEYAGTLVVWSGDQRDKQPIPITIFATRYQVRGWYKIPALSMPC